MLSEDLINIISGQPILILELITAAHMEYIESPVCNVDDLSNCIDDIGIVIIHELLLIIHFIINDNISYNNTRIASRGLINTALE